MKHYRIAPGTANEIETSLLKQSKAVGVLRDPDLVFAVSAPEEYRRLLRKHSSVFGVIPDSGISSKAGAFSDSLNSEHSDSALIDHDPYCEHSDSSTVHSDSRPLQDPEENESSWPQGAYLMEESAESEIDDDYLRLVRARCREIPYVTAVGERIFLREFWEEDLPEMPWLKGSLEERREQIASYRNHVYLPWSIGIWGIFRLSDGKLLGRAGLEYDCEGEVTLGYEVSEPFRRQGYALEAVLLALNTFRKMDPDYAGFRPVVVNISPENEPSVSLIKKAEKDSPLPLEIRLV